MNFLTSLVGPGDSVKKDVSPEAPIVSGSTETDVAATTRVAAADSVEAATTGTLAAVDSSTKDVSRTDHSTSTTTDSSSPNEDATAVSPTPAEPEVEATPLDQNVEGGSSTTGDDANGDKTSADKSSKPSRVGSKKLRNTDPVTRTKDNSPRRTTREGREETKRDGESRLAADQITNVLEKARTREDVEGENRKLRSDLTNMRRRLNMTQDCLNLTKNTVNKFSEELPPDFRAAWASAEAKIKGNQEELDTELSGTAGEGSTGTDHKRQQPRSQRRPPWRQRLRGKGNSGADDQKPRSRSVDPNRRPSMNGVRHTQVGTIGAGPTKRRNRRNGQQATGTFTPRRGAQVGQMSVEKIAQAERVRDQLRAACTADGLQAAITKAKGLGMTYEADIGSKKLDRIKSCNDGSTTAAAPPAGTETTTTAKVVAESTKPTITGPSSSSAGAAAAPDSAGDAAPSSTAAL